ncbi:MAG: PhzF family phenazine biosynthesis protein [Planctomycetes bacterium]|nr:PhzF family phenazine biosynthesis protein [Planctomycetota bacterium]
MGPEIWIVDAFAVHPFGGNPAAVCVLEGAVGDAWRVDLAAEMKHSETAFLEALDTAGERWRLRWFTPVAEVELCGHATLASAHVLFSTGRCDPRRELHFETRSGLLRARCVGPEIELDFPSKPGRVCAAPAELELVLGTSASALAPLPLEENEWDLLVPLRSEAEVLALAPAFAPMAAWPYRCVIATAPSEHGDHDFVSRVFAPRFGVDEDPVTGSAHCFLAPHWSARLGKRELRARQASARGGELGLALDGERVRLRGACVTILAGRLAIAPAQERA